MQVNFIKNCLKGVLTAIILSVVLLLVFSFIAYTRDDPDSYLTIFAGVALYASAFVCGFVAAKKNRQSGLLCGLVSGIVFMALVILLSLLGRNTDEGTSNLRWVMYLVICGISLLGGIIGVPSKAVRKRKKTRRA